MKALFYSFFALVIFGCASTSDTTINLGNTPENEIVLITDKCDSKCTEKVNSTFVFESSGSLFKKDAPTSYVILSEIDDQRGTNTYYDPSGSFNSTWDGGYQIKTSPKKKTIKMYPTAVHMSPSEETEIVFTAQPGQEYFVGSIFRRENVGNVQINYWSPIVMNTNSLEILIPSKGIEWRKYCIAAREFSASVACPKE
ncbi:hypothetical protein [Alteromonas abrolhosensis]|uniref:hypothetical protein n=1 Tax=Alteromonas abrolhosensis TaxID=1892904 RepID=UPI00096B8C84|nr:hypothetical protein [Alteromonas abrolhosensis]